MHSNVNHGQTLQDLRVQIYALTDFILRLGSACLSNALWSRAFLEYSSRVKSYIDTNDINQWFGFENEKIVVLG